jgi:hypothetical protein
MNKNLFLLFITLVFIHTANAKVTDEARAIQLYQQQHYISSAIYAKQHIKNHEKVSQQFASFLEDLVAFTSTEIFYDLSISDLLKINSSSFHLIAGKKMIEIGDAANANKILARIPITHKYKAEALLYAGVGLMLMQKEKEADKVFFECAIVADDLSRKESQLLSKRYYKVLEDRCNINRARVQYQLGQYQNAIEHYQQIDKRSFLWPYTLSEKAWSFIKHGDANRALGLAVTYKAPLLESYFTPESELIMALAYKEKCLWKDAELVIQNFYNKVKPQSDRILQLISKLDVSNSVFNEIRERKNLEKDPFIRSISTQLSKKVKYNFAIILQEKTLKELEILRTQKDKNDAVHLLEKQSSINLLSINKMIKESLIEYLNKINKASLELFNISIEILADQRDVEYAGETISNRARGSYKNVPVSKKEYFYSFDGAFWADELGDYSFGLASNCKS